MTTKREILGQALEELGIADYNFDIQSDELAAGLRRLDRIAAQWDGTGIRVNYNSGGGLEADSGLPDFAVNCFALNLAVQWGPSFGKTVSMDTKIAAKQALNSMLTGIGTMPEVPYPASLPVGTGNRRSGVRGPQYFPDTDEIVGLNDGATSF